MTMTPELFDWIISQIIEGKSQRELASMLGVPSSTMHEAVHSYADPVPERAGRLARAMKLSAEGWLDRGLHQLEDAARTESNVAVQAARAIAQECARRAAIRNPAYREGKNVELAGSGGGPVQFERIERVIVKPNGNAANSNG